MGKLRLFVVAFVAFGALTVAAEPPLMMARLRGVSVGVKSASWRALRKPPVAVPVERRGADAEVAIPAIAPWCCGWLCLL